MGDGAPAPGARRAGANRSLYSTLQQKRHRHGQALHGVGDRLLKILVSMLQPLHPGLPLIEASPGPALATNLVCLSAIASKALLGPDFRLMKERGRILKTLWAPKLLAALHPSAVLRAEDRPAQDRPYGFLLADLKLVASELSPR